MHERKLAQRYFAAVRRKLDALEAQTATVQARMHELKELAEKAAEQLYRIQEEVLNELWQQDDEDIDLVELREQVEETSLPDSEGIVAALDVLHEDWSTRLRRLRARLDDLERM
jgi:pantothenate synthetase